MGNTHRNNGSNSAAGILGTYSGTGGGKGAAGQQRSVNSIIQTAEKAAERAKHANYIHVHWSQSKATLTTHVNGDDAAWIEYDAEQLDELIRQLQLARSELLLK